MSWGRRLREGESWVDKGLSLFRGEASGTLRGGDEPLSNVCQLYAKGICELSSLTPVEVLLDLEFPSTCCNVFA